MYKGANRFSQARASSGRTLSSYPKSRKIGTGTNPLSGQAQFEVGSAYIKMVAPLIRGFLDRGLGDPEIADELVRHGVSTPSGKPWTPALAADLVVKRRRPRHDRKIRH